jgi:hypothetical protein
MSDLLDIVHLILKAETPKDGEAILKEFLKDYKKVKSSYSILVTGDAQNSCTVNLDYKILDVKKLVKQ